MIESCPLCQGTKRVLDSNVSEGMLGTFSDAEIRLLCTIPCPRCTESIEIQQFRDEIR